MKILYVLQPSVNDGKKFLAADSNFIMMKGIINELNRIARKDLEFVILLPFDNNYNLYEIFEERKNIDFRFWNYPVDAFQARWYFNQRELPKEKFDIVWCNIAEQTAAFKYFYKDSKIVYCNYFMDLPYSRKTNDYRFFYRQVEGAVRADLVTFTCESTRDDFLFHIHDYINELTIDSIQNKTSVWDFGFSQEELLKYSCPKVDNIPIILFPNRITNPDYTHFEIFKNAINELNGNFEVVVTNPSCKYFSNSELSFMIRNYKNVHNSDFLSRKEVIKLLWESSITVHLFDTEKYGGCAHRESIFCYNIVVTPKLNEYLKIQGESYPFYCKTLDVDGVKNALNEALENLNYKYTKTYDEIFKRNLDSSFENIAPKVYNDLKGLMR